MTDEEWFTRVGKNLNYKQKNQENGKLSQFNHENFIANFNFYYPLDAKWSNKSFWIVIETRFKFIKKPKGISKS